MLAVLELASVVKVKNSVTHEQPSCILPFYRQQRVHEWKMLSDKTLFPK